ncbi:CCA tRNA nucleotidyltransferase [Halobacteriales archaeon QS_3_64_16]|nr:MAG: CCA tRNA nucleotidyltransferase [Halobacteriales archaeon QS_3_64_16]
MEEAFEAVVARAHERATPDEEERALLDGVAATVFERAEEAITTLPVDADVLQVGSTARDTWVSGDRDVDVFVRFPADLDRPALERYGLAIGNEVLPDGREEYAEHPYVTGEIQGVSVDLVPCYRVESATEIRSAVDRTPFHTRYLDRRLDDRLAGDVRVLKTFLTGIEAYGSDLRTEGFSGYLAELLVCEYGSFADLIEAAADWSPTVRLDPESHGERSFEDPLVVIDPTDPDRNIAAVLSGTQLARFQHYARELLTEPRDSLFEESDPEPLSATATDKAIAARGTTPIALRFSIPDLVNDQLYPQLRKSNTGIERALEERGFRVLRRTVFATEPGGEKGEENDAEGGDEERTAVLFFELAVADLPAVERHEGPPVSVREHARSFCGAYAGADATGPFVEDGRYVVERPREFTSARDFLASDALFGAALGVDVETALEAGYDLLVDEKITTLAPAFGTELARYFAPKA